MRLCASSAAAETQQPVTAQVVGNAFVSQYYHILHQSLELVHKFEEDNSMNLTTIMQALNQKIVLLHSMMEKMLMEQPRPNS